MGQDRVKRKRGRPKGEGNKMVSFRLHDSLIEAVEKTSRERLWSKTTIFVEALKNYPPVKKHLDKQ